MQKIDKTFKNWKRTDLQKYLGLTRVDSFPPLAQWLQKNVTLSSAENDYLAKLAVEADKVIDYWNETELREKFIIELIRLVKFDNYQRQISSFSERYLSVIIKNEFIQAKTHGFVDWLVAIGIQEPEHPFFFIHEYKAEEGQILDGRGQLLITMYVAQQMNQVPPIPNLLVPNPIHYYKDIPIYGIYVVGRNWYFLALQGNHYAISQPLIATKPTDLQEIVKRLKTQKQIIHSYLP